MKNEKEQVQVVARKRIAFAGLVYNPGQKFICHPAQARILSRAGQVVISGTEAERRAQYNTRAMQAAQHSDPFLPIGEPEVVEQPKAEAEKQEKPENPATKRKPRATKKAK